jgi:aspartate/methionine/tyrosine aminotransferase
VPQVGWCTGSAALISAVAKAHQFLVFTVPSNLQRAVAYGIDHEASFYEYARTHPLPSV